jgi:hypothetical protein
MKVETDIITSMAASLMGQALIIHAVIIYVETFKTDIVFIFDLIICLMSH